MATDVGRSLVEVRGEDGSVLDRHVDRADLVQERDDEERAVLFVKLVVIDINFCEVSRRRPNRRTDRSARERIRELLEITRQGQIDYVIGVSAGQPANATTEGRTEQ